MVHRVLGSISIVVSLVTSLVLTGAGSASAERSVATTEAHRYCHVLISSSERDVHGDSKVLASACSSVSSAAARREFDALRVTTAGGRQVQVAEVAASTLIMSWFQSYDANGPFGNSTTIYGNGPTCDTSGYGVGPNAYWAANLSYIIGVGRCNRIRVEDRPRNNRSSVYSDRVGLAPPFNDNVGRVQVFWSGGS